MGKAFVITAAGERVPADDGYTGESPFVVVALRDGADEWAVEFRARDVLAQLRAEPARDVFWTDAEQGAFVFGLAGTFDGRSARANVPRLLVDEVAERYVAARGGAKDYQVLVLKKHLGAKPFEAVTAADLLVMVDAHRREITRTGGPGGAVGIRKVMQTARHLWNWAIDTELTERSPFYRGGRPVKALAKLAAPSPGSIAGWRSARRRGCSNTPTPTHTIRSSGSSTPDSAAGRCGCSTGRTSNTTPTGRRRIWSCRRRRSSTRSGRSASR